MKSTSLLESAGHAAKHCIGSSEGLADDVLSALGGLQGTRGADKCSGLAACQLRMPASISKAGTIAAFTLRPPVHR